ncbi:hypothetical protein F4776DRAFT_273034 [Hypoxylon sp. NC0597]|nr:hypothetical protein F4776DRAFT_273034 [Hypoxylon sp. NC0597]
MPANNMSATRSPSMPINWNLNGMKPDDQPRKSLEVIISKCQKLEQTTEELMRSNKSLIKSNSDLQKQLDAQFKALRQAQSNQGTSNGTLAMKNFFFGFMAHLLVDSVVRSHTDIDAETRMFIVVMCCAVVGFFVVLYDQPTNPPEAPEEAAS